MQWWFCANVHSFQLSLFSWFISSYMLGTSLRFILERDGVTKMNYFNFCYHSPKKTQKQFWLKLKPSDTFLKPCLQVKTLWMARKRVYLLNQAFQCEILHCIVILHKSFLHSSIDVHMCARLYGSKMHSVCVPLTCLQWKMRTAFQTSRD